MVNAFHVIENELSEEQKQEQYEQLHINTFDVYMWSKEKYSEAMQKEELLKAIYKRYAKSLPLKHLNVVFFDSAYQF